MDGIEPNAPVSIKLGPDNGVWYRRWHNLALGAANLSRFGLTDFKMLILSSLVRSARVSNDLLELIFNSPSQIIVGD